MSLRKTMLMVALVGLGIVVVANTGLPQLGVEHVIQFGFALIGLVVAGGAVAAVAPMLRNRRPRHARSGRLSRVLKGGGAHI